MSRTLKQRLVDTVTFPLRAMLLFYDDRWGLSSLRTERFDYCSQEAKGRTLDLGCGPHNLFITRHMRGNGVGVDVFQYDGLSSEHIVPDPTRLPFDDGAFDTVTFIANLNHVPAHLREAELAEVARVLTPEGRIIVTMGNPLAEIAVHKVVELYDRFFGTKLDVDAERGMEEDEELYLLDSEIRRLLRGAGFNRIRKRRFWTQWGLNHMLVGDRR